MASPHSPPIIIDQLTTLHGEVRVARDDLLDGGTKQRGAIPYLQDLQVIGFRAFAYASPFCGYAQVALARACQEIGATFILFCEESPSGGSHAFTELARSFGAETRLFKTLSEAELSAEKWAKESTDRHKIPLGLDAPSFHHHLEAALRTEWDRIRSSAGGEPHRLWLPVGSGTLTKIFRRIASPAVVLRCVNVHVLPRTDSRIRAIESLPGVELDSAPETFHETVEHAPPVRSNLHYDAKLWRFLQRDARRGDLWWNVAR